MTTAGFGAELSEVGEAHTIVRLVLDIPEMRGDAPSPDAEPELNRLVATPLQGEDVDELELGAFPEHRGSTFLDVATDGSDPTRRGESQAGERLAEGHPR